MKPLQSSWLPGQELAEAIHLLFAGEKPKSSYPVVNPDLHPDRKELFGFTIPVAPILDLIMLKLNSLRPKDVVHLDVLDQVGFLTPEIVSALDPVLQERLTQARRQFSRDEEEEG